MATKAPSRPTSVLASRTLKTVGVIMVLATLIDLIILPMPYQWGDRQWQISVVTQLVDRGIVPLVGLVLFLTGYWIDSNSGMGTEKRSLFADPRFWACALASLLGLAYLIMFPLHLYNVNTNNQEALQRLNEQATQAESQILGDRLKADVESQREQISLLLTATDEQIQQLIQQGRLTQEQADLVKRFKANPKELEPFLQQREQEARTQLQTRIGSERQQQQQRIQSESLKSGIRVSISTLLLSIGFAVIGWTGLRYLLQ